MALDGVRLELRPGEVVGLVGENGAGKTTLLKCILGLVRPDAGEVRLAGQAVRSGEAAHRRRIGYVSPVERSFYLRLSCRDNLLFFSRLYGGREREARARVERALAGVSLADRAGDRVDALSSGMRQRLALARALLHEPELLLLDEPTRSLDPVARGEVHELVRSRGEGKSVLIASHDLDEIEHLCRRVVVLNRGRVVAEGSVEEIRRTLGLGEAYRIRLDRKPESVLPFPGGSELEGNLLRLRIDRPEQLGEAIERLVGAGIRILEIDRENRPLEEAIRRGGRC
jgi:ABC-2 type transport system ATP-binding protein